MDGTRTNAVALSAREVVCPYCKYSLRGLSGGIITCPECGSPCDVTKLAPPRAYDWTSDRNYVRVMAAAIWLEIAALVSVAALVPILAVRAPAAVWVAVAAGLLAAWLALVIKAHRALGSGGAVVIIKAHLVPPSYLCGTLGLTACAIALIFGLYALFTGPDFIPIIGACVATLLMIGLIRVGYLLDRSVGHHCMRITAASQSISCLSVSAANHSTNERAQSETLH